MTEEGNQSTEVVETKEEREARRAKEEQELCDLIKQATGKQLFQFMVRYKNKIGVGAKVHSKYFDLCMKRARELNQETIGDWEDAKRELDAMFEPQLFESQYLLPIKGYDCMLYTKPDGRKEVCIFNEQKRTSYSKIFNGRTWEKTVKESFK